MGKSTRRRKRPFGDLDVPEFDIPKYDMPKDIEFKDPFFEMIREDQS